jgi:hypothetical protein
VCRRRVGGGEIFRACGPREIVALPITAAEAVEVLQLRGSFYPFGYDIQTERSSQADQEPDDLVGLFMLAYPSHERSVDLERVNRELLKIAERAIPSAEVVEADTHSDAPEALSGPIEPVRDRR